MKTVISKDGTKIAYDTHGSGPALIYVTGASVFRKFAPVAGDVKEFAKEFTVYSYDRRGRGDSGDNTPYSVEHEVEDIEALIDAAGGSAYVKGHSSGAVLVLEAAMRLGKKVKKVAIYDASYVSNDTEKREYAKLKAKVKTLLDDGDNAKAMKTFLSEIGMPKAFVALLPIFPGWRTMKSLAPTLMYDIALTENTPPFERVAKITTPTYIMYGQKSPSVLHSVASQLGSAISGARVKEVAGQDHMVSPKVILPELVEFFKGRE